MTDTTSELPDSASPAADERNVSLRLEDVTKTFEKDGDAEIIAVDNVNLEIYDGEFIVLVGPSGCGKTTTLRMIAGLESVTKGKIFIEGTDVSGYDPRERDIAMVFQNYALYPHKTVHDNLGFPLQIRKYSDEEIEQQVNDVADLLDISELLNRRPGELSGGQQQRVSLGRAIIRDPQLFLFDEPLSNLDAKLRIQMRTELNKLHDRVGKTSIYVTHDQAEAMTLGDRVAVMNDGRIQQIDRPQEIYLHPENRFVASFVGEPPMNFFFVSLEKRAGSYWALSDQFEFALPESMANSLDSWDGSSNDLELGIRPEDFHDRGLIDRSVPDNQSFEAYVKVVEPMGPQIDLTLSPLNQTSEEDLEFTARISNESTAAKGETIDLFVELENTHLFDGETGKNITKL